VNLVEIDKLSAELGKLHEAFDKGQREMAVLAAEEEKFAKEARALEVENQRLEKDLNGFDEVKTYWENLTGRAKKRGSGTGRSNV
jgi:predicted  nucleic acid-binding Zn-ribbon protein